MAGSGGRVPAWLVAVFCLSCGARPSSAPLAGSSAPAPEGQATRDRTGTPGAPASPTAPTVASAVVAAPAPSSSAAPPSSAASATPVPPKVGDGYLQTLVLHALVRVTGGFANEPPKTFDAEADVRQELRFKVTAVDARKVTTLELDYGECSLDLSGRGESHTEPLPTQRKAYRVQVGEHELGVSSRTGAPITDDEVVDVREDARFYLALDQELRSATTNAAPADLHALSRFFPVKDNPVKVTENKIVFRRFVAAKDGSQQADYDFAVAMQGAVAELSVQGRLAGTMLLGMNPWRPLSVKGSGPITLHGSDADFGASGSGTLALEITYSR